MGNPVVHFEIGARDPEALSRFYGELLGWKITPMEGAPYAIVDTQGGEGINGGIDTVTDDRPQGTIFYIAVSDINAALEKAVSLGATKLMDVVEMPGIVTFVQLADPQGNRFGLVLGADGDAPALTPGDGAPVGWFEVLGTDGPALRRFYGEAFGWTFKESGGEGMDYGEADTGGGGIPGGVGTSQGEPVTTVYAAVDDVEKYLERVESLGGARVMGPMDVGGGTEIGAFRDPAGNLFGLFKHVHPHA